MQDKKSPVQEATVQYSDQVTEQIAKAEAYQISYYNI